MITCKTSCHSVPKEHGQSNQQHCGDGSRVNAARVMSFWAAVLLQPISCMSFLVLMLHLLARVSLLLRLKWHGLTQVNCVLRLLWFCASEQDTTLHTVLLVGSVPQISKRVHRPLCNLRNGQEHSDSDQTCHFLKEVLDETNLCTTLNALGLQSEPCLNA